MAFGFWLLAFGFWLLAFSCCSVLANNQQPITNSGSWFAGFWLLALGFWLLAVALF
jgi:hypothetical protein